jgi:hypothetical protein
MSRLNERRIGHLPIQDFVFDATIDEGGLSAVYYARSSASCPNLVLAKLVNCPTDR